MVAHPEKWEEEVARHLTEPVSRFGEGLSGGREPPRLRLDSRINYGPPVRCIKHTVNKASAQGHVQGDTV